MPVQSGFCSYGEVDSKQATAWSTSGVKVTCDSLGGCPVLPVPYSAVMSESRGTPIGFVDEACEPFGSSE